MWTNQGTDWFTYFLRTSYFSGLDVKFRKIHLHEYMKIRWPKPTFHLPVIRITNFLCIFTSSNWILLSLALFFCVSHAWCNDYEKEQVWKSLIEDLTFPIGQVGSDMCLPYLHFPLLGTFRLVDLSNPGFTLWNPNQRTDLFDHHGVRTNQRTDYFWVPKVKSTMSCTPADGVLESQPQF